VPGKEGEAAPQANIGARASAGEATESHEEVPAARGCGREQGNSLSTEQVA